MTRGSKAGSKGGSKVKVESKVGGYCKVCTTTFDVMSMEEWRKHINACEKKKKEQAKVAKAAASAAQENDVAAEQRQAQTAAQRNGR